MTYSIAACDLDAGQWGVATQSKFLAVGSVVPWAEPHVGAIATQAYANPRYGPDGLRLLRDGLGAQEVVESLVSEDDGREHRQLGVVDGSGARASYTGSECMELGRRHDRARASRRRGTSSSPARPSTRSRTRSRRSAGRAARRAAARRARRGPGRGRRPPRPAVGGAARRRARRRLRGPLRLARRPARRRPRRAARRAAAALRRSTSCSSARRPPRSGSTSTTASPTSSRERLARLGYDGALATRSTNWAGTENLEERVDGVERIDPVVLEELRRR